MHIGDGRVVSNFIIQVKGAGRAGLGAEVGQGWGLVGRWGWGWAGLFPLIGVFITNQILLV